MKIFSTLYKCTSWLIPLKTTRTKYKNYLTSLDLKQNLIKVKNNYKCVIEKLKNKTEKIKVIFLIRENQKWTYQSVYEEFEKSDKFEPLVLVSLLTLAAKGKDKTRNNLQENYEFFKSRGMNVDYAYKNGKYVDLEEFKPDIVFYDQEWDLPEIHMPEFVSKFALTFYSLYGSTVFEYPELYTQNFHRFLFRYFVENELNIDIYSSQIKENKENCVVVGYPKLDEYFKTDETCNLWKHPDKLKVIYAPHHSLEQNGMRLATFKQNYKFILELAKKYPQTTWIFKPHPRLKYAIMRTKLMNEDEVDKYWKEWEKIGTVYEKGNYINLFKTSDLMITDCDSFLVEYLPNQKPLIRLVNEQAVKLNEMGRKITQSFYSVYNNNELENIFEKLVVKNQDEKSDTRKNLLKEFINSDQTVAKNIYNCITEVIQ